MSGEIFSTFHHLYQTPEVRISTVPEFVILLFHCKLLDMGYSYIGSKEMLHNPPVYKVADDKSIYKLVLPHKWNTVSHNWMYYFSYSVPDRLQQKIHMVPMELEILIENKNKIVMFITIQKTTRVTKEIDTCGILPHKIVDYFTTKEINQKNYSDDKDVLEDNNFNHLEEIMPFKDLSTNDLFMKLNSILDEFIDIIVSAKIPHSGYFPPLPENNITGHALRRLNDQTDLNNMNLRKIITERNFSSGNLVGPRHPVFSGRENSTRQPGFFMYDPIDTLKGVGEPDPDHLPPCPFGGQNRTFLEEPHPSYF